MGHWTSLSLAILIASAPAYISPVLAQDTLATYHVRPENRFEQVLLTKSMIEGLLSQIVAYSKNSATFGQSMMELERKETGQWDKMVKRTALIKHETETVVRIAKAAGFDTPKTFQAALITLHVTMDAASLKSAATLTIPNVMALRAEGNLLTGFAIANLERLISAAQQGALPDNIATALPYKDAYTAIIARPNP